MANKAELRRGYWRTRSKIEWTGSTWNPVTGCTPISTGCRHCYARRLAEGRLRGRFGYPADEPFRVTVHPDRIEEPRHWKKHRRVFVCSMGDLFHDDVPQETILAIYAVMMQHPEHTFQILTKRIKRAQLLLALMQATLSMPLKWPPSNIWQGVTVENAANLGRVDELRKIPAAVRFVSLEPLLGDLPDLDLAGIDWVIVGGETGPGARPMHPDWVRSIHDQCEAAGVPFFFKGWGEWLTWTEVGEKLVGGGGFATEYIEAAHGAGWDSEPPKYDELPEHHWDEYGEQIAYRIGRKAAGRLLDGVEHNEYPAVAAQAAEERT